MPRKAQGKHTSPEKAGVQNISPEYIEKAVADDLNTELLKKTRILLENRVNYSGQWTDELFNDYVNKYFQFCEEHAIEPAVAGLRLWLGTNRETFNKWLKSGSVKADILHDAIDLMEYFYFMKLDSRPVPNIFKLKTKHGYVENQKIEVVAEAKVSADEIKDRIAKMAME